MKKNDIYIAIMKYAYENIGCGLTDEKVKQHLEKQGLCFNTSHKQKVFGKVFNFILENIGLEVVGGPYSMRCEAYFRYLEYIALEEARQSSRNATYFATAAIFISLFTLYIAITS